MLACVGLMPTPAAGLHRFYVGKIGTGLLWLLTGGLLTIGTIVDIIRIASGTFRDKQGRRLLAWSSLTELEGMTPPAPPEPHLAAIEHGPTAASRPASRARSFRSATLSFLGGMLLLTAFVIGLAAAVNVPAIINAGWPDPHLANELRRLFGYAGWPQLMLKVAWTSSSVLLAIGALFVLIARRHQGAAHVLRAILGAVAMFGALQFLGDTLKHENWPMLLDMFDQHRAGPAIELFIDTARSNDVVAAGAMFVAALVLFAWPARRYPADVTIGGQGVSS